MVLVTDSPINPSTVFDLLGRENSGSAVFHYAVVKRNTGRQCPTEYVEYLAQGDVMAELEVLASGLKERWLLDDVLMMRRIGRVPAGEIISLVAATSPNSADAFEASRYGTSLLKRMATIHKREVFGGS
ncbi:molybdenum cofactor biosynthesis protein MoaE [Geomonas sp. RF6]|uniref:molybdenum cofactor biosynthesis protein MoaE n=1 Tax=Geomonas sp. RF6 TaxID=2897342 RepID=UPI001E482690|nr:molybdenum cofactor biosynthesis protein MoaE [Geomonas sp. RF6]UFS70976.1 molybdenum cofactor biosynthesis protein MoaE [Geomonas sp. RF6]